MHTFRERFHSFPHPILPDSSEQNCRLPSSELSKGFGMDQISALLSAVDHEDIPILLHIVSGDPPPILVTEWWASVVLIRANVAVQYRLRLGMEVPRPRVYA